MLETNTTALLNKTGPKLLEFDTVQIHFYLRIMLCVLL